MTDASILVLDQQSKMLKKIAALAVRLERYIM